LSGEEGMVAHFIINAVDLSTGKSYNQA
jgi:hypothetical protein